MDASLDFLALDVETANADAASICQVGIARFEGGEVVERWVSLVDPRTHFDPFNVGIHGIGPEQVVGAPTFAGIFPELRGRIQGNIVVHHMPFDKTALRRACEWERLDPLEAKWVDSAQVVRRTWEQFRKRGYGLANVAEYLGISFQHHDALEDAEAAGKVFAAACAETGRSPEAWHLALGAPARSGGGGAGYDFGALEVGVEGPLVGEVVVFTGTLSVTRWEAAEMAAKLGAVVKNSVTKETTLLVVGLSDWARFDGYDKSSKHRKAEQLATAGHRIRIVSEADFWGMGEVGSIP